MLDIKRDQNGVDRCQHIVEAVKQNDPKNPAMGFTKVKAYCNKPITFSVSEGRKVCPDCDKQPPIGWVNPRITNASATGLTPKEMEECGLNPDGTRIDGKPITRVQQPAAQKVRAARKPREAKPAVEAKVKKEIQKDVVLLEVPLALLEANEDVAAALIRQTMDAFGKLPVTNYAESKRLMLLEEKLKRLLEA